MAPELTTTRLRLRRWHEGDLEAFALINADARVMEFFPKPLSRLESDSLATRIRSQLEEGAFGLWAVEVLGESSFVGFVGLAQPRFQTAFTPCIEIGWRMAYSHWGKGFAFEAAQKVTEYAFHDLQVAELVSFTAFSNMRSQRLMQRLGFTTLHSEDFNHPSLPEGHPLQHHVLYRLSAQSGRGVS
jgi:RimJ/RimL family protein N-acetyltransferase